MMEPGPCSVAEIYAGSDGAATIGLYARLEAIGPMGVIAVNLFRACKASERAKVYRGGNAHGRFKAQAYEKKEWSLELLVEGLTRYCSFQSNCSTPGCGYPDGKPCIGCGFIPDNRIVGWGWKEDPGQEFHKWVLYIDLPTGQVSFHAAKALTCGLYHGEWDGQHLSAQRIIAFADGVLNGGTDFEKIGKRKSEIGNDSEARQSLAPPPQTGNLFRDQMFNNRGITTNS